MSKTHHERVPALFNVRVMKRIRNGKPIERIDYMRSLKHSDYRPSKKRYRQIISPVNFGKELSPDIKLQSEQEKREEFNFLLTSIKFFSLFLFRLEFDIRR